MPLLGRLTGKAPKKSSSSSSGSSKGKASRKTAGEERRPQASKKKAAAKAGGSASGPSGRAAGGRGSAPGGGEGRGGKLRRAQEDPAARPRRDDELTLAEVFDAPRKDKMARIGVYVVYACAVAGVLSLLGGLLFLYAGGLGAAGGEAAAPESDPDKDLAVSTAENFSAAYLKLDAGESETEVEERLAGFSTPEAADAVAPKSSGKTTRTVSETSAYDARPLLDGRWVVYTRSTVETEAAGETSGESSEEDGGGSSEGAGGEAQSAESATSSADGEGAQDASTKTVAMEVFVAVEDGEAAVDAAPNLIKPPSASDGSYGAIFAENQSPLSDEDLISLLEGYFDSLYGSVESQATLDRFFVEGGPADSGPPTLPDDALSFVEMGEGWTYPVGSPEEGSAGFAEAYDVEVIVRVADEEAGITANQTHLLRVTREGSSWAIVGTTPSVGNAPAAEAPGGGSGGTSAGAQDEKGGEE